MPASPLVDEDCRIIIRNADLEDIGEITRFTQWQHTLKLNEVSSWQLDLQTKDFESYGIDENTSLMFYRDDELLIDGPVMPNGIQYTFSEGVEKTTVIGGCDNAYLGSRICYPVVSGPLFDTNTGNWRFGKQRSGVGISSAIIKGVTTNEEYEVPLVLEDAVGFLEESTATYVTIGGIAHTGWDTLDLRYAIPLGIVPIIISHYLAGSYVVDTTANTDDNTLTYSTSFSSTGIRTFYAMFEGNAQYAPCESPPLLINVGKPNIIPLTLSLEVDNASPDIDATYTVTATLGQDLYNKSVTIYHYFNGTKTEDLTANTDVNGQISFATSFASAGELTYTASYAGDSTYSAASSGILTINVGGGFAPESTSITLTANTLTPAINETITLTATFSGTDTSAIKISGVDMSTNTVTLSVPQQYPAVLAPIFPDNGRLYQTSGGIVDDPTYLGYDTQTGVADIVAKRLVYYNAGKGACADHFGTRAIPHLVVAPPTTQGSIVTCNSRGEILLAQIQNVCLSGGINFRTRQIGKDLVFETFVGGDLSQDANLVFSVEMGNLKEYSYTYGPPLSNLIWGCGPQTGVDKIMLPSGNKLSIEQYGRWESWLNTATADAGATIAQKNANMVQQNNIALAQSLKNSQLTLTIQETDQVRYPRDFGLGDKIRIMAGKKPVDEIITNIMYTLPGGTGSSQGSSLMAALTKQETRQMRAQIATSKLLQQITMA